MKVFLGDNNVVLGYAVVGDIPGSIEVTGSYPEEFREDFKPNKFVLSGNNIVGNPNYSEETPKEDEQPEPSELEKHLISIETALTSLAIGNL